MQAGEHPAGGAGQIDGAQQLSLVGTQHAGIGQHHRADFLDALVNIEKDNKENQRDGKGHLAPDAQTKPHGKNRRKNHARHGVERLDVRIHDGAGHGRECQPQPAGQAQHGADAKGQHGLQQSGTEVDINVGVARQAIGKQQAGAKTKRHEPGPNAPRHLDRLTKKKSQLLVTRGQLPHGQKSNQHADLPGTEVFFRRFEIAPHVKPCSVELEARA